MSLLVASLALAQVAASPVVLKTRIVEASVFKAGLVLVVREAEVPKGTSSAELDTIPEAFDGSFWVQSTASVRVKETRTELLTREEASTRESRTVAETLFGNVGKPVRLVLRPVGSEQGESVSGSLVAVEGPQATVKLPSGNLRTILFSEIRELDTAGLDTKVDLKQTTARIRLTFSLETGAAGKIRVLSLESGAAWSGSYLVRLQANGKARIQGKAQIATGGLRFDNTEVQLLSGLPNLPRNPKFDLMSGYGSLKAYLEQSQGRYREYLSFPVDPFSELPYYAEKPQPGFSQGTYVGADDARSGGFGGGGFGGGGRGGRSHSFDVGAGSEGAAANPDQRRVDDLFSYPLGKIDLKPGDRVMTTLFDQDSTFESVFAWDAWIGPRRQNQQNYIDGRLVVPKDNEVASIFRFMNTGKVPWTQGSTVILRDSVPVAQLTMPFTPVGQNAELTVGTVQDILVSSQVSEIKREEVRRGSYNTPQTTYEVTLKATNTRDTTVRLLVRPSWLGEPAEVPASIKVRVTPSGESLNPLSLGEATIDLKSGESVTLKFTYKRFQ